MSNIAIDVTSVPAQPAGIGNYVLNLVDWLSREITGGKPIVFGRTDQKARREFGGCAFVDCGKLPISKRILWEQTRLPVYAEKHGIDLLHSPNYTIPLRAKCKRVCTIHDLTCFLYPRRRRWQHALFFRLMMRQTVRRADCIIAVSENTKRDIERILRPVAPVRVAYQGYSPLFQPLTQDKARQTASRFGIDRPYLMFVGTIEPSKNLDRLIDAFLEVHRVNPMPLDLVLVGKPGWGFRHIMERVHSVQASKGKIFYLGYQDDETLVCLYNLAFGVVYPSLYEGFGIPPLEAMACGTPVVCSNTSSLPEVVGDAALVFDPTNTRSIAEALLHLSRNGELRRTLKEKGLARARMFTWQKGAQAVLRLYEEILGGPLNY